MVRQISEKVASEMISAGVIEEEQRDIYQYSVEILLSILINLISSVILFAAFGRLIEGLVFLAAFIPLRTHSGGYHSSTHLRCYILSMAIILAFLSCLKMMPVENYYFAAVSISLVSSLVIFVLTPVGCRNKPLDDSEISAYRKISLLVMAAECAVTLVLLIVKLDLYAFIISLSMAVSASALLVGEIDEIVAARENL